jgi:hypothetical protein
MMDEDAEDGGLDESLNSLNREGAVQPGQQRSLTLLPIFAYSNE